MCESTLNLLCGRAIYVEMLGHDASFAHIKALQFASEPNIITKKVCRVGRRIAGVEANLEEVWRADLTPSRDLVLGALDVT